MSDYDQVFWLNVTNIFLGMVTLACVLVIGYAALTEIRKRAAKPSRSVVEDDHALVVTGLGITMADGGKPRKTGSRFARKHRDDEILVVTEDGIETVKSKKRSKGSKSQTGDCIQ